jgi:hypothetical protein
MKKLILGSLVAATLGAAALPAAAYTNVDFYVNVPPPAPRYEVVPAPRHGHVWVPGYWEWRGHRHIWVAGHWVVERPGYVYAPARWVERDGRYYYTQPGWRGRRDSDGDGVPDRYDHAPYNARWR